LVVPCWTEAAWVFRPLDPQVERARIRFGNIFEYEIEELTQEASAALVFFQSDGRSFGGSDATIQRVIEPKDLGD
jgi:hypothetical protein